MMACKALGAHTLALRNKEKWQSVGWKKSVSKTSSIQGEHTGKMKAMPRLGGKNLTVSPLNNQPCFIQICFTTPSGEWGAVRVGEKKQMNKENTILKIVCSQDLNLHILFR